MLHVASFYKRGSNLSPKFDLISEIDNINLTEKNPYFTSHLCRKFFFFYIIIHLKLDESDHIKIIKEFAYSVAD